MSFFDVPATPKGSCLEAVRTARLKEVGAGSAYPEHVGSENWSLYQETDGRWTVRCCGDIMYGPCNKAAAKKYFDNMVSK